ncbi:hypothetical protein HII13_001332 [Brettanomyces bruxellensis]|nr:hypothetical protein HII13_001332 [Brettanomyces bruxellensis]
MPANIIKKLFGSHKGSRSSSVSSSESSSHSNQPHQSNDFVTEPTAVSKSGKTEGANQEQVKLTVPYSQKMVKGNSGSINTVIGSMAGSLANVSIISTGDESFVSTAESTSSGSSVSKSVHSGMKLRRFLGGRARRRRRMAVKKRFESIGQKIEERHTERKESLNNVLERSQKNRQQRRRAVLDALKISDGKGKQSESEEKESDDEADEVKNKRSEQEILVQLSSKYGEVCHEKDNDMKEFVLGQGAGGAVILVKRSTDGHMFAVKKFKKQNMNETAYDYKKKLNHEYEISAALFHPNVIHTYDLLKSTDEKFFAIVMDYCPYDFFCPGYGVSFLHHNGFAHRDLKLDNCVITKDGILKLIDYGSVAIFDPVSVRKLQSRAKILETATNDEELHDIAVKQQKEEENGTESEASYSIIKATGVAGSDPYLAPECLKMASYDPRAADIWSVAIIYCCIILHRFPWKLARGSDIAYSAFIAAPSEKIDAKGKKHVYGPNRLLRAIPSKSRNVIRNMLALDPKKRYTIDDCLNDSFVDETSECSVIWNDVEKKYVVKLGEGHKHHLISRREVEKTLEEKKKLKKEKKLEVPKNDDCAKDEDTKEKLEGSKLKQELSKSSEESK